MEIAASVLDALHRAQGPLGVSAIAQASGLAPARVHHYLVSLVKTGLVRRSGAPPRYSMGPFAIRLGLAAVDKLEVQHFSAPFLHQVSSRTHEASFFTVWSDPGPVIVRWEQGHRPLTVYARLGTVMPLLRSATGDVFCTWGDEQLIADGLAKALLQYPPSQRSSERAALRERVEHTLHSCCGMTCGALLHDVSAVAAPVFGEHGDLAGAITVLGLLRDFDATPEGFNARCVRSAAEELSRKLGYREEDSAR